MTPKLASKYVALEVRTSFVEGTNSWVHSKTLKLRFFKKTYRARVRFLIMWWNIRRLTDKKLLADARVKALGLDAAKVNAFLTLRGVEEQMLRALFGKDVEL